MQINLGAKIRQYRHRDGRTQEALAEALGVTSQAVSRWESGGSYPDMNLLPSIANYFGVSIDELFGYNNDRREKIDSLISRIRELMPWFTKRTDDTSTECITLAREGLIEFPGNERLMLSLASALFQAGYVRHGEYHLIDNEGYSIYDVTLHRNCAEWKEAIPIYEKLLTSLPSGDLHNQAVDELSQLYLNMGEYDKALVLADSAPDIFGTKELLHLRSCDGKERAQAYGKAILKLIRTSAELTVLGVIQNGQNLTAAEKAESIRGAIALFDHICTDDNYCDQNPFIGKLNMLLSVYLWAANKQSEAFEALDRALAHFRIYEKICEEEIVAYSAPLTRLVTVNPHEILEADSCDPYTLVAKLHKDWPWWHVPEEDQVRNEMQADPRWDQWVKRTQSR